MGEISDEDIDDGLCGGFASRKCWSSCAVSKRAISPPLGC